MTPASSSKTTLVVSSEAGPGRARTCEPITIGIPMPRGLVTEPRQIALVDGDGKPVPLQALPTERWPDGSVRWALLDFQANGPVSADGRYELTFHGGTTALPAPRLQVTETAGRVAIDTFSTPTRAATKRWIRVAASTSEYSMATHAIKEHATASGTARVRRDVDFIESLD